VLNWLFPCCLLTETNAVFSFAFDLPAGPIAELCAAGGRPGKSPEPGRHESSPFCPAHWARGWQPPAVRTPGSKIPPVAARKGSPAVNSFGLSAYICLVLRNRRESYTAPAASSLSNLNIASNTFRAHQARGWARPPGASLWRTRHIPFFLFA